MTVYRSISGSGSTSGICLPEVSFLDFFAFSGDLKKRHGPKLGIAELPVTCFSF